MAHNQPTQILSANSFILVDLLCKAANPPMICSTKNVFLAVFCQTFLLQSFVQYGITDLLVLNLVVQMTSEPIPEWCGVCIPCSPQLTHGRKVTP